MFDRLPCALACAMLLAPTLSRADEPVKPTDDRIKAVRQMYAKLPGDILGFAEPTKRFMAAQKTGHGVQLVFEDANDKKLTITLMNDPHESLLLAAGKLPPRGPEESAIYGLLLRLAAKPPEKTMKPLLDQMDAVLAVLDRRIAGAMPIGATKPEK